MRSEGAFTGAGGVELYYQCWKPDDRAKAAVGIVHGVREHSGRYAGMADHLTPHGYAVYCFDNRGHGRSPGQRGHINAWQEYRDDTDAFMALVRAEAPDLPLVLLGHSMGALVALDYLLYHPEGLRGAIISGAPLEPIDATKPVQLAIARVLSRIRPTLSMTSKFGGEAVSRDPAVAEAYDTDPLVHNQSSVRWGMEFLATIDRVKSRATEVKLPILMLHGGDDRIVSPNGSRRLFEQIGSTDKELKVYPDRFHEAHNDIGREEVLADIVLWLDAHL
jgi:alpha-beta hydrolase superfamily lysophospholipase